MPEKDKLTQHILKLVGSRMKNLRIAKGYSNYENFAYESEISRAQYGKYENGGDLRLSSLIKVLKTLDIDLNDFFNEAFAEEKKGEQKKPQQ